ncbi:MAG: hypothetical protein ACHQUC_07885 [Chlamydiales bacterium]
MNIDWIVKAAYQKEAADHPDAQESIQLKGAGLCDLLKGPGTAICAIFLILITVSWHVHSTSNYPRGGEKLCQERTDFGNQNDAI